MRAEQHLEKFWQKVDKDGGAPCWIWTGALNGNGYGRLRRNSFNLYPHRVAYEYEVGPIPEGFQIDHLCGVRACVNPDHLEAVSQYENNRRAGWKGMNKPK